MAALYSNLRLQMRKFIGIAIALCYVIAMVSACDSATQGKYPRIETDPSGTDVQMTSTYTIKIMNTGDAPLTISSAPTIAPSMCPDGTTSAFSMVVDTDQSFPYTIAPAGAAVEGDNTYLVLTVTFLDPTDLCGKTATVTIVSNDLDRPNLAINITRSEIEPAIEVAPNPHNMGFVPVGPNAAEEQLLITNSGLANLEIYKIEAIGFANGFAFVWDCNRKFDTENPEPWATDKAARIPVLYGTDSSERTIVDDSVCAEPMVVLPGSDLPMPIFYTAISEIPARTIFRFTTNDPDFDATQGEAYEVTVQANFGGPCITVNPELIDFGSVVYATGVKGVTVNICSCGDENLEVTKIYFGEGSSPDFSLDVSTLATFDETHPLTIEPGQCLPFVVKFIPGSVDKDLDGKLIPDEGTLLIDNNSPREVSETPIKGLGVEAECAVCQFEMLAGGVQLSDNGEITPMDENDNEYITFTNHSYDPTVGGGISSQLWTVEQPNDSVSLFIPAATYENPKFSPHIVGEYNFCLEVFNNDGCSDKCCKAVKVIPPQGCHIELTWNTPADTDQTDECFLERDCGADMDLHMVHPLATGKTKDPETGAPFGFFDMQYDCYWMIPHPTWDTENAGDPLRQPNLDRDDTDGAGPENWTYTIPDPLYSTTAPACYRVGVHYYDDHTFGKSYPTVKVFINSSTPVYEKTLTGGMGMLDMWDVGRVCCSNQDTPFVERVKNDGTPLVVHNYADESLQ